MAAAESDIFHPVPGGCGKQGWTYIFLEICDEVTLLSALKAAWKNLTPNKLHANVAAPA